VELCLSLKSFFSDASQVLGFFPALFSHNRREREPSMLSFTVRMRFESEDREKVVELLHPLTAASRQEPGCVTYVPHFIEGDNTTILIYEQYRNEAALDFHRSSPHFAKYAIGGLYQLMKDRQVENLTAIS
jgi:quinol monooxygenase YgiN